jgi:hypothetical protein
MFFLSKLPKVKGFRSLWQRAPAPTYLQAKRFLVKLDFEAPAARAFLRDDWPWHLRLWH